MTASAKRVSLGRTTVNDVSSTAPAVSTTNCTTSSPSTFAARRSAGYCGAVDPGRTATGVATCDASKTMLTSGAGAPVAVSTLEAVGEQAAKPAMMATMHAASTRGELKVETGRFMAAILMLR